VKTRCFKSFFSIFIVSLFISSAMGQSRSSGQPGETGEFDYYLLALSWSPAFCASPAGQKESKKEQCSANFGFVIHGLWPQFSAGGWPENCIEDAEDVDSDNALIAQTGPLQIPKGDLGFLDHEWKKHGTCDSASQVEYFRDTATAASRVTIPKEIASPNEERRISVQRLRDELINSNKGLSADAIEVNFDRSGKLITEIHICLSKKFEFTPCLPLKNQNGNRTGILLSARKVLSRHSDH